MMMKKWVLQHDIATFSYSIIPQEVWACLQRDPERIDIGLIQYKNRHPTEYPR